MYSDLETNISYLESVHLSDDRRRMLMPLIQYIRSGMEKRTSIRLHFICTHNSRRSQLAQVWMDTLTTYYGIDGLSSYSGGTEVTAVFPAVIKSLEESGFRIVKGTEEKNPIFEIYHSEGADPIFLFSKKYNDPVNPSTNFGAIMTCSEADRDCPIIPGADVRISIPYSDPKKFDETTVRDLKYKERSHQIAAEMSYVLRECLNE